MVRLRSGPSVLYPDCLLPSAPCGRTGTGPFGREPSNSTGGTLTHERNHLHGLLRRILTLSPNLVRRDSVEPFQAFRPSYSYPYSARRAVLVLDPKRGLPSSSQNLHWPEYE